MKSNSIRKMTKRMLYDDDLFSSVKKEYYAVLREGCRQLDGPLTLTGFKRWELEMEYYYGDYMIAATYRSNKDEMDIEMAEELIEEAIADANNFDFRLIPQHLERYPTYPHSWVDTE